MPLALSYPNHAVYQPIDYATYPAPETLESVSFWRLTVEVTSDGDARLATALQHYAVDV